MNTKPKSRLLRSGAVTAFATFLSRILGMLRDIAIASILGASLSADVYFFANRIPNFFRRLFAEGAFSKNPAYDPYREYPLSRPHGGRAAPWKHP